MKIRYGREQLSLRALETKTGPPWGHGEAGSISVDWAGGSGDRGQNYHIVKILGGTRFFCECPNRPYLPYFNG